VNGSTICSIKDLVCYAARQARTSYIEIPAKGITTVVSFHGKATSMRAK